MPPDPLLQRSPPYSDLLSENSGSAPDSLYSNLLKHIYQIIEKAAGGSEQVQTHPESQLRSSNM